MANEDVQGIIARLRAAGAAAPSPAQVRPAPADSIEPSRDQSRGYSRDALRALGYDDETIESVAPLGYGAGAAPDMAPDSLNGVVVRGEAQELLAQRADEGIHLPEKAKAYLDQYLEQHGDEAVAGLASINKYINNFAEAAGEKAAAGLARGSTNLSLGMGLLDVFTRLDNQLKLDLFAPEEKKALMKEYYLPKEKLLDPTSQHEFGTASEMALWMAGEKAWGAANSLASVLPALLSKALGSMGLADASAYLQDLAQRDRATAAQADEAIQGQVPQMVAGMAPYAKYQDIYEAGWDPTTLDNFYAQLDDPGNHGPRTAAALSGLWTIADFYGSPTTLLAFALGAAPKAVPALHRAVNPGQAAEITADIARKTYKYEDAKQAVAAATKYVERTKARADKMAEQGFGSVQREAEMRQKVINAEHALAREEHWSSQFKDPGTYEPIMPRPARRNPEYIPELTERQYPLSAGGRSTIRVKPLTELAQEPIDAEVRLKTLTDGAHLPVDWNGKGVTLGQKSQRLLLGADDAEYAGDALNMLSRGAEIDDITTLPGLAPEYYVLPDVQTSLIDTRRITETTKYERARRATEGGAPSIVTLEKRLKAAGTAPAGTPGARPDVLSPAELLKRNEAVTRDLLGAAKRRGDKVGADELRGQMRQLKKVRANLSSVEAQPFETGMLPSAQKGIMQSPERYNNWLAVAGNRVMRSLYPGGLVLHGWNNKLGQMISMGREPMRYYLSYDPAAWERIRGGLMRNDKFVKAGYHLFNQELKGAGVITERPDFNLLKHFSPEKVNAKEGQKLFKLLNTTVKSDEHLAMYEAASPEMRRAHDRIRVVLNHFADLQGISDTERYLTGYIRHVFDASHFKGGARPIEFIGLPQKFELFASHLQQRQGMPGYLEDPVLALDMYVRAAYKKLIMEPVYDDIQRTGIELAKKHDNPSHITYANDLVNQLKGKPDFLGAKIDELIASTWNAGGGMRVPFSDKKVLYKPGEIERKLLGIFSLVHSGLTTGPHYAILQLANGLATTASRVGPFDTMRGLFMMGTKEGQQLAKAAGTYRPFVDFLESPTVRKFTELAQSKIKSPPLFISNQQAENWSRGITYNAAIKMYLRKAGFGSLREAEEASEIKRIMFEAARASEEVNHLYGPLGRSPWVTRTLGTGGSTATQQLLSYIPKQTEEIMGQTARNPGYILAYLGLSGQIARMAANAGIDMTGDVGLGYWPENYGDITSPAVDAALDNLRMLDALDKGDADGVERYAAALAKSLTAFVPGSQTAMGVSKMAQRLGDQSVRTAGGDKLYSMQMQAPEGSGIGGELVPTITMQRNLRETLTRRGIQANRQEDRRFAYNFVKALDDFAEAEEAGDSTAAATLAGELSKTYKYGAVSPEQVTSGVARAREARSVAYTVRSVLNLSNGFEKYVYLENLRKHGVSLEP